MKKQTYLQSNQKKTSHKRSVAIVSVALITTLLLAVAFYRFVIYKPGYNDSEPINTSGKDTAQDASSTSEANAKNGNFTTESVPDSKAIDINIQGTSQSGGYVVSSASLSGIDKLSDNDSCVFQYEHDGAKPVVRGAKLTSTTDCDSGSIPEVEFSIVGNWSLKVTVFSGGTKSQDTTTVDIK